VRACVRACVRIAATAASRERRCTRCAEDRRHRRACGIILAQESAGCPIAAA
jgi:hypothetical protein